MPAKKPTKESRQLSDLTSVGPATLEDLSRLGIRSVSQLKGKSASGLYQRLCRMDGVRHDPCCEDTFAAAIAQADDPKLPAVKKRWWYWSRVRKAKAASR